MNNRSWKKIHLSTPHTSKIMTTHKISMNTNDTPRLRESEINSRNNDTMEVPIRLQRASGMI